MEETHPEPAEKPKLAAEIIEKDLLNPPSLKALAGMVGCTAHQLTRSFQNVVGKTIPEFVRDKRIDWATQLLESSDENVGQISSTVGYASLSAFSRAFVRRHGVPPHTYRLSRQSLLEKQN